jgi:single-strand DNA-binding protein
MLLKILYIYIIKGLNKVIPIGNLGKEPEYQVLDGNVSIAKFSLATNKSYKDKDGNFQTETDWHSIIMLGKYCRYCLQICT